MLNTKKTVMTFSSQSLTSVSRNRRTPLGRSGMISRAGWGSTPVLYTPITAVKVNERLLAPLQLDIDPDIHFIRNQEKEQIKTLNNRFASFIDKVCFLEQQNKMLATKWSLLQEQTSPQSNIDNSFKTFIASLQRELDGLGNEKLRLESGLRDMFGWVEDFKSKYEDEIGKRIDSDNTFVQFKKDADDAYLNKAVLESQLDGLTKEINFLWQHYEMELLELKTQIKDMSVVVEMDNSRDLNMDAIVAEVRAHYEDIANRTRAEAECWYKKKYEEMQWTATKHGDDLKSTKAEIAEYKRRIARIHSEMELLQGQNSNHKQQTKEAEERGEKAVKDAQLRRQELEAALLRDKQDMARQVRQYQSLMNIKMALDIEIATYRKLLEGEESRMRSSFQTSSVSKPNPLNYDFESSHLSSQSPGKDVHNAGFVEKEVMIAKGDSTRSFSSSSATFTTIITSEAGFGLSAIEGSVQVMDMSAIKLEEDVF